MSLRSSNGTRIGAGTTTGIKRAAKSAPGLLELQSALAAGYAVDLLAIDRAYCLEALGEITGERSVRNY